MCRVAHLHRGHDVRVAVGSFCTRIGRGNVAPCCAVWRSVAPRDAKSLDLQPYMPAAIAVTLPVWQQAAAVTSRPGPSPDEAP